MFQFGFSRPSDFDHVGNAIEILFFTNSTAEIEDARFGVLRGFLALERGGLVRDL
jgi:hypothetical protein